MPAYHMYKHRAQSTNIVPVTWNDEYIFYIEYLKKIIMALSFAQSMTHIDSLNNKILYAKSWDLYTGSICDPC